MRQIPTFKVRDKEGNKIGDSNTGGCTCDDVAGSMVKCQRKLTLRNIDIINHSIVPTKACTLL